MEYWFSFQGVERCASRQDYVVAIYIYTYMRAAGYRRLHSNTKPERGYPEATPAQARAGLPGNDGGPRYPTPLGLATATHAGPSERPPLEPPRKPPRP